MLMIYNSKMIVKRLTEQINTYISFCTIVRIICSFNRSNIILRCRYIMRIRLL